MEDLSGSNNPTFTLDEVDLTDDEKQQIPRFELKGDIEKNFLNVEKQRLSNGKESSLLSADNIPDHTSSSLGKSEHSIGQISVTGEEDYSLLSLFSQYEIVQRLIDFFYKNKTKLRYASKLTSSLLALAVYITYFITVLVIKTDSENEDYWCDRDGLLIAINIIVITAVTYNVILKRYFMRKIPGILADKKILNILKKLSKFYKHRYTVPVIYLLVISSTIIFLVIDTVGDRRRLISLFGIAVLILFGFIFSTAPRKVVWRHVIWGMGLQFVLGILILRWAVGRNIVKCIGNKVNTFLLFTDRGSSFLFGPLISEYNILAFKVLSVILFVGLFVQILYFYGVVQWVILKLGWLLQVSIGTTACESVSAASNIFLGMAEAPLLIKPYLPLMTNSELHAVLTGGFATIAGTVLAAFISFGVDAAHLLSASVMSAPAALAFSKLFYPEVEKSRTKAEDITFIKSTEANVLHAGLEGVTATIPIVTAIAALLIAFISLIAFIDAMLSWPCELVGIPEGTCTLSNMFGYAFTPLAWIMGVPWNDCYIVGQLLGTKTVINEFVAYGKLGEFIKQSSLSQRAITISTYALCGFSNIPGIGIQMGIMGAMVPERKADLAKIITRSMVAGSVACFLTACVAGALISND